MNKMKKYLMVFAALFATMLSFTACSSDNDLSSAEEEGNGVVKADFTISFPKQMSGTTRQSTEIVQGQSTPVFRGITGIELMPFKAAKGDINGSSSIPSSINLTAGTVTGKYGASSSTMANTIDATGALYKTSNSHLYKDIEIAIGTRAFMFYGKAIDAPAENIPATNGSLVKSVAPSGTTLDAISFSLTDITTATVDAQATAIAAYLTNIAKASSGSETMLTYFPNFTNLKAGSYASMKAVVQAVYTSLYKNTDALSTAIKNVILAGYTPSGTDAKTITVAEKSGTTTGELEFTSTYTYPRNIFLPDGAAQINWNTTTKAFDVVATSNVGLNISALTDYTYPASLYYYGLSDIWAVPASMSGIYDGKSWANIVKAYTDRNDASATVQSNTRSIAIRDEVQYAVGRLDVTVQSEGGANILRDNKNVEISLGTAGANFPIKGILVGNQKAVKYNFETNASAAPKTIYDSQMPTGATLYPGTSPTTPTHTLVLQTVDATSLEDDAANVPIAIEFENAGNQIIVGKDNELIYPGTRFYLLGTLKPFDNTQQKYVGTETPIKKAFVQDYITTANFTVKSFKNAYHTLPDLRTPSLEIGLSVDLTWKTGIPFDITIE